MLLAAGQPIKVISEILGHATSAFTADVYTEVAQELADAAAAAIAAFVPRKSTGRASTVPARNENDHCHKPGSPRHGADSQVRGGGSGI